VAAVAGVAAPVVEAVLVDQEDPVLVVPQVIVV
jgi:hypothetical protein